MESSRFHGAAAQKRPEGGYFMTDDEKSTGHCG